jgi:hypothetical protein
MTVRTCSSIPLPRDQAAGELVLIGGTYYITHGVLAEVTAPGSADNEGVTGCENVGEQQ